MNQNAIFIGNSDGIGLGATKRLLEKGWYITGISRSDMPITHENYTHHTMDIASPDYPELLSNIVSENQIDLCIHFAGMGELFDPLDMSMEANIIEVNFTSMVKTAAAVVPVMVKQGSGHFIGLSSIADDLISAQAPSYHASKAGFTNYMKGIALALKSKNVHVTNVRFGFVDTKLAKGDIRPFMMSVEKSVDYIEHCMRAKPVNFTAPKIVIPLIKFRKFMLMLGAK